MLNQQTLSKLYTLSLHGMAKAFEDQLASPSALALSFQDRFGLLVDNEITYRDNRRLQRLLKNAKMKASACMEDIDYRSKRGLDRSQVASLATCGWIDKGLNLILTGPTGTGKTWLACALGNQACRHGKTVFFVRLPLLIEELQVGHADGSFRRRLMQLSKFDLVILDDFGIAALGAQGRADLLEVIDCRADGRSTIVTSQIPVDKWHDYLSGGSRTVADAILDRVIGGSLRLQLSGTSLRTGRPAAPEQNA